MGSRGVTLMVMDALAVPPGPVAVMVYTVVSSRVTSIEPDVSTDPIPGSITTVSASVDSQVRVADWPAIMSVESTLRLTVGSRGVTLMVTDALAVPPGTRRGYGVHGGFLEGYLDRAGRFDRPDSRLDNNGLRVRGFPGQGHGLTRYYVRRVNAQADRGRVDLGLDSPADPDGVYIKPVRMGAVPPPGRFGCIHDFKPLCRKSRPL